MSGFPPGTFEFADRIAVLNVEEAHRDARARRLQRQISSGRRGSRALLGDALAWLGQRLTSWGEQLQQRYGTERSVREPQSPEGLVSR